MEVRIVPEPTDEERAVIVAAFAQEETERAPSPWVEALLPRREEEPEP